MERGLESQKDAPLAAIELRELGKYTEAQSWLRKFIKNDPTNAEALSLLCQILLLDKKEAEAERALAAAAAINPALPSIHCNQARLLLKQLKTAEALERAQLAWSLSPHDTDTLLVLAACLGANGRGAEAQSLIETILTEKPDCAEAYSNRALIKLRAKDRTGAIEDAKMSVTLKPHLANVWSLLASLYYEEGKYSDGVEAVKRAHELEPANPPFLAQLGQFLLKLNKAAEAIPMLKQATELAPEDPKLLANLAVAFQQEKRSNDAKAAYKKSLAIDPTSASVLSNLGALAKDAGEFESALHYFERALEIEPNLFQVSNNMGVLFKESGRLFEAEANFRRALALAPDYVEALNNLGNTLKAMGRLAEAEASYDRAIAVNPNYPVALNNLGNLLYEQGRLIEAESRYEQALNLRPGYLSAHENLGNALSDLGQFEEAVHSYQKAFSLRTGIRAEGAEALAPAVSSVFFELTNKCNFHCTFCPSDSQTRDSGSMDLALAKKLYKEASDKNLAAVVNLHLMGEPTLHPQLLEILKFAASTGVKTDLVTNGSTLVEKTVPQLLDALYGTLIASHMTPTEETYHFRGKVGVPWERYIANLRLLVREYMQRLAAGMPMKNEITLRIMVTQDTAANANVITSSNEAVAVLKEWSDFVAQLEEELGVPPFEREDYDLNNLVRGNNYKSTSYLLQRGIKLTFWRAFTFANTRVHEEFHLETVEGSSYCPKPFTDVGILWNGDVTLCGLDHDGHLTVGNVHESSIETVIQSKAARDLRAAMLGRNPLPAICRKCQERPVKRS